MRLLKGIFCNDEINIPVECLNDLLSEICYGSAIYYLSSENFDKYKNLSVLERSQELAERKSIFTDKRIGLHCKRLIGSPLILHNREDEIKTRSFTFVFENEKNGIKENVCEIVDNYPDIFNTRDIIKYSSDEPIFTDTPVGAIIKSMYSQTKKFYHVIHKDHGGFALFETPAQREAYLKSTAIITKGKYLGGYSRDKITKKQALNMLEEDLLNK